MTEFKGRLVAVVACLLMSAANAHGQEKMQIRLLEEAQVSQRLVTVGDVAEISGADSSRTALISGLDLDVVPATDEMSINANQVRLRIILEGIPSESFEFGGAGEISVQYSEELLHRPLLESLVRNSIADQFGIPVDDIRVTVKESPQIDAIVRTIPATQLRGIALLPAGLPLGETAIQLELTDGAGVTLSHRVPVRIVIMKDVVVTQTAIPRGTVISAEHLREIRRPVADRTLNPVPVDECIGRTAARDIPQHEVIRTSYLSAPGQVRTRPLLSPNDYVDVVVQTGPVSVRLKNARVLSSGSPGDVIQVMNLETNTRLAAIVQDRTTVLLRN